MCKCWSLQSSNRNKIIAPESFIFAKDYHHSRVFSRKLENVDNSLSWIIPIIQYEYEYEKNEIHILFPFYLILTRGPTYNHCKEVLKGDFKLMDAF